MKEGLKVVVGKGRGAPPSHQGETALKKKTPFGTEKAVRRGGRGKTRGNVTKEKEGECRNL